MGLWLVKGALGKHGCVGDRRSGAGMWKRRFQSHLEKDDVFAMQTGRTRRRHDVGSEASSRRGGILLDLLSRKWSWELGCECVRVDAIWGWLRCEGMGRWERGVELGECHTRVCIRAASRDGGVSVGVECDQSVSEQASLCQTGSMGLWSIRSRGGRGYWCADESVLNCGLHLVGAGKRGGSCRASAPPYAPPFAPCSHH